MRNEFYQTRQMFREYTNYTQPLGFDDWDALPEDQKAAVLYLQFFDQITLAWEKTKSTYSKEEDGVSEVLRYLMKNVDKIHQEPKRFTPAYIYKVAYNCLYCVCRDPNRFKREYENECSNIHQAGDEELDLFDLCIGESDITDSLNASSVESDKQAIWAMIEDMDVDTQKIIAKILDDPTCLSVDESKVTRGGDYKEIVKQSRDMTSSSDRKAFIKSSVKNGCKTYSAKALESISQDKIDEVIEMLKVKLMPYRYMLND